MRTTKSLPLIGTLALLTGAALSPVAQAQTTQPTAPNKAPPAGPTQSAPRAPTATPGASGKSASQAPKANSLVGMAAFSSDGTKVGTISREAKGPDGKVRAIRFKTGGFLGFGGKVVEVPDGKFTRTGDNVRLGLSADEVSKLPEVKG
ncbi:MAG TPA: PRC-barrel domain-containing protein [Hyphomicrobiaceae bacterium]|jgi:hypothetical protein|nr:PRC-barrel domain-containing protein [Hyphomicrobiaceae bacterium]